MGDFIAYLPPGEEIARRRFEEIITSLQELPHDPSGYGLIHQDAHTGNLFLAEDGTITLFDFDDCCYGHYIYDIAMVLFYAVLWKPDPAAFTRDFMANFLRGYSREFKLDPAWLEVLPLFLQLREVDLYATIHRSFDVANLDDPWVAGYMRGRKERIDTGQSFLDFDFQSLAQYL